MSATLALAAYRAALLAPPATSAAWRALAESIEAELHGRADLMAEGDVIEAEIVAYHRAVADCYRHANALSRVEHPEWYAPHSVDSGWRVVAYQPREVEATEAGRMVNDRAHRERDDLGDLTGAYGARGAWR